MVFFMVDTLSCAQQETLDFDILLKAIGETLLEFQSMGNLELE